MLIQMRTIAAGPDGTMDAGKAYDLDAAKAAELIAGGYANPVKHVGTDKAGKPILETVPVPAAVVPVVAAVKERVAVEVAAVEAANVEKAAKAAKTKR